mgnify:CR=1 FL=1
MTDQALQEIRVPDIGNFHDVEVIEVLVGEGDHVEAEQPLITIESEKAALDVPAPATGTIAQLHIKVGDKVSEGTLIAHLQSEAASGAGKLQDGSKGKAPAESTESAKAAASAQAPEDKEAVAKSQPSTAETRQELKEPATRAPEKPQPQQDNAPSGPRPPPQTGPAPSPGQLPHASPAVRKLARELGVDLTVVHGTGPKGRILKDDLKAFIKATLQSKSQAPAAGAFQLPAIPAQDFAQFGPIEEVALSRIKRLSGPHLHASWLNIPHVTQFDEADITELEAFRREEQQRHKDTRITLLAFLLKACAATLQAYPEVNSSLTPEADRLILKRYIHIGIAVDTPEGLVVPVIRDVPEKGILALANEAAELAQRARQRKLKREDLEGGSFSISSLGGIGGTAFTPIVNAPQVAILGVSRSAIKPVFDGQQFQPRLMLPLSFSYDHRVVDGAMGARFTTHLAQLLGDLRRLLL